MLNKTMIIGHLGADPEMRYTANGSAVTTFRVASGRTYTDGSGERKEETEWFRVVAWNKLGEVCAQHLTKGRLVYVEGRLQTRSWDDQQGVKKYLTELVAQEVKFLGGKQDSGAHFAGDEGGDDLDPSELPF